ncbi:hypothetical protein AbraIFM66951_011090 [Aspergillus brasiliensis]|uniref:Protein kinase domain-containing protein n=1 Tax=Aspergillus brasiliensis TaxID=319629 RepID=A0A9W5YMQ0_9EURO|nr:hypothetical protein AbraCBS73388_003951 [Aspergillus brasiliensis]GKZ41808.1 hypothetical protein AbraIFM66951_011090 [Aspergillus brasiliensis]
MSNNDGPELIGIGRVGRVMRFGDIAVKTANIWTVPEGASETTIISYEQTTELNKVSLKHEGHVYSHLGYIPGVIQPYQVSDTEIRMPYMRQCSLSHYLRAHRDGVDNHRRLQWLQEAAHIIRRIHERRVLVADIATRNFLLEEDLSLQICDFTESVIVADDENMTDFVSEDFVSVKSDIETDLDDDPEFKTFKTWPTADTLPNLNNVFLGDVIGRCWARDGCLTMQEVCHALDTRHG